MTDRKENQVKERKDVTIEVPLAEVTIVTNLEEVMKRVGIAFKDLQG